MENNDTKESKVIDEFMTRAMLLELLESDDDFDWAISALAAWIANTKAALSPDDRDMLIKIGGVLYRTGAADIIAGTNKSDKSN